MRQLRVAEWEEMVRRYEMGATLEELAAELNCVVSTARRHLAQRGAVIRSRGPEKGRKPKASVPQPKVQADVGVAEPKVTKPKRKVLSFGDNDVW